MFVSLEKKPCLIVGGGRIAARKCRGLLAFGAEVTVIAQAFSGFDRLHTGMEHGCVKAQSLHKIERSFQEPDLALQDWALVIAATNDRKVNGKIAAVCRTKGIPVNVADCKEECTFFFPAYCMEENVAVGVTTSGISPEMASAIRQRLEKALPEWLRQIGMCKDGKEADGNA